jgi:hypothetical protein
MLKTRDEEPRAATVPRVILPRFGVAIFDDSRESGWASLPDGEAMRFNSPHDLQSDCIWVCSAEGQEFRDKWSRLHHMRPTDYVSKLAHIASDFGLTVGSQGRFGSLAQRACSILSPTIHKAMVIATQSYGWQDPISRLKTFNLVESIRNSLYQEVQPPRVQTTMTEPLTSALQTTSSPVWHQRFIPNSVSVTLRYNRLEYAQRILATLVPEGEWAYESQSTNPRFHCPLERALDPEFPCIVEGTVEFQGRDPDLAALCAFGSTTSAKQALRTCISQTELMWLKDYARINIHGIYTAASSRQLPRRLMLPEMLTNDPLFSLSVSAGLVAEAHWKALANTFRNRGTLVIPPWSVWLRAADRAMSFKLALLAYEAGFHVAYYGNGSVLLNVPRDQLPELLNFAEQGDIAHPCFRPIFEENGLVAALEN